MKVFISADMEGISGVVDYEQIDREKILYQEARQNMIREVNAAIEGAFSGGAEKVLVNDAHDYMINLKYNQLDSRAEIITGCGKPLSMMQGIEGADVAIFMGYHAMAGTGSAILDHTYSGKIYRLLLQGRETGETGFNAAIAGYFKVPVIAISGDLALCREAKKIIPWVETITVKEAIGRKAAKCLPFDECCLLIQETLKNTISDLKFSKTQKKIPLYEPGVPVDLTIELITTEMADLAEMIPGIKRQNGREIKVRSDNMLEAAKVFLSVLRLIGGYPDKLI